ncbi:hypothetical protein AGOR_G00236480 [Albula goreensis]|uniref:Uncharacterized protein n=1 Tax=Albula goreensis TaxID=1534307 RepID=A0A8T3CJ60_9TELE|nr:hypothetical protein AGOR_G00236480 [Albula goreensis]
MLPPEVLLGLIFIEASFSLPRKQGNVDVDGYVKAADHSIFKENNGVSLQHTSELQSDAERSMPVTLRPCYQNS